MVGLTALILHLILLEIRLCWANTFNYGKYKVSLKITFSWHRDQNSLPLLFCSPLVNLFRYIIMNVIEIMNISKRMARWGTGCLFEPKTPFHPLKCQLILYSLQVHIPWYHRTLPMPNMRLKFQLKGTRVITKTLRSTLSQQLMIHFHFLWIDR